MTHGEQLTESSIEREWRSSENPDPALRPPPFLSAFSHELSTPLGSVLMIAEMMLDQADEDPARARQAQMIHHAALDMRDLIEQVSLLARIQGGRLRVDKVAVATEVLASRLEEEFRDHQQVAQVELTLGVPPSLVTDATHLVGAIRRLLAGMAPAGNAARVVLGGDPRSAAGLKICVWRPASGVTEEQVGAIFEPFHPVARIISRSHGGQSLDLTIARALLELLGGSISADVAADGAVVFTLDPGC